MAVIEHLTTEHVSFEEFYSHTSDIEITQIDGRDFVMTVGYYDGAVHAWEILPSGLSYADSYSLIHGVTEGAGGDILHVAFGNQDYILSGGGASGALRLIRSDGSNVFRTASINETLSGFTGDLHNTSMVALDNGDFMVFGAVGGTSELGVVTIDVSQMDFDVGQNIDLGDPITVGSVTATAQAQVDGAEFIFAATAASNEIITYEVNTATGTVSEVARLDDSGDLWIDTPSALDTVTQGDNTYVLITGYGSSSLTVARVGTNGALDVVDHILSDSLTYTGNVTALATVQHDGDTYVAMAGNGGGFALYVMLDTGALVRFATRFDDADTTLMNVSDIEMRSTDDGIDIFVSSSSEYGLTHLFVDTTNDGGLLSGTSANDTLSGSSDTETLFDGAGNDTMTGGAGADLFVLDWDGEDDTITDFRTGIDRLDLSLWEGLNTAEQLTFIQIAGGVRIAYGDEQLTVYSYDGYDIYGSDFDHADLFSVDRVDLAPATNYAAIQLFGTLDNDELNGNANDNSIYADVGDDIINGMDGGDEIYGEAGNDIVDGGDGDDVISGGDGNDVINGSNGRDTIEGDAGDDILDGGRERDTVRGGEGNDILYGYLSHDRLYGDAGNDKLYGSNGSDYMKGGDGHDYLVGGRQADSIFGGAGNDQLRGGSEDDKLRGEGGNDKLYGQAGSDRFIFADNFGSDTIFDFEADNGEQIDLSDVTAITDYADLVANHLSETAGGSAEITDGINVIRVSGVGMDELIEDHFIF